MLNKILRAVVTFLFLSVAIPAYAQTTMTFSNPGVITIPDFSTGLPYPSTITVSGMNGTITNVTVTIVGMEHNFPDDGGALLVGPTGVKIRLFTDAGGGIPVTPDVPANLTFDDAAPVGLPDEGPIVTGSFKPTFGTVPPIALSDPHPVNFASPAPMAPYSLLMSDFDNTNANGVWSLYTDDDTAVDGWSIMGGWSVTITTQPPTASSVAVSGRIMTAEGRGISRAIVIITDKEGNSRHAVTNGFGYYRFDEIAVGQTYIVSVRSKRYSFEPRIVTVSEELANLDFWAN